MIDKELSQKLSSNTTEMYKIRIKINYEKLILIYEDMCYIY